jgi:HPt (histidine-containing phosphotransfer) domain-containing protein
MTDVLDGGALDLLLETVGGDREFFEELLESFFEDSPEQLGIARKALAEGNAETLRRAAHSLKSNSANFGALALSQKCKDLEELAKSGCLGGAAGLLEGVAAEYERAEAVLRTHQPGA